MIPFNLPYITGEELRYINEVFANRKFSGDGAFTKKCQEYFQERYKFRKVLLTSSCTDALEMSSILAGIQPGDEVIIPSYTFVSSVNPFILRGAKVVFADSNEDEPNIAADTIAALITPKTKAIVVVHYGGIACDMDKLMAIAEKKGIIVIEDAAQAIDAYYKGRPLGSIGHLAAFSFHDTKNISSGEGGILVVNDPALVSRAEIIWEKGTNRSAFLRGEVDKYTWVDVGSSFLPSEMTAAFLYAQLQHLDEIQAKRNQLWSCYHTKFTRKGLDTKVGLPFVPEHTAPNGHVYYVVCKDLDERSALIGHLQRNGIKTASHYLSLHKSPFFKGQHDGRELPNADRFTDCLLRLPFYAELKEQDQEKIVNAIAEFYNLNAR